MADEGGAWSSDGGQRWGADYSVQGEIDFTKDLHRRDEWSDISEDESPVVYADISRSGEYHYHIIQPQGTPVAMYENEGVLRKEETPAASGFPYQESVVWREHQHVARPEVSSQSMAYMPTPYPPALCQMAQNTGPSFLYHGVLGEGEKLNSNNTSVTVQKISAERNEDLSNNVFYQGSQLEGTLSVTSSLANEPAAKLETLETAPMGLSSQKEPHPPDTSSSGQSLSYLNTTMLPPEGTYLPYREGQLEGKVESGHDSCMTLREQVASGITGFLSSAALPLVTCHKGETSIPLECLSQQCGANPSVPQEKDITLCKSEPSPTRSDKRITMTDQHFLKECSEKNCLDVPGQGCTNIDSSKVMKHLSLAEMDSLKDRGHAQLGVIGVLKKQKRKVCRRQKKKSVLKIAELLEIAKESGGDIKDACHTNGASDINMQQSDMQRQHVQLNYTNEKSLPSSTFFQSPVTESIYNLSVPPLSKSHIQDPLTHSSKCLDELPINSSKSNVKSALHKRQKTQDSSIFSVPQVPQEGAATELAQKTGPIFSGRKKGIRKTQNKKRNVEEDRVDSLKQPVDKQGSGMTSLQEEGNPPLTDDIRAMKLSSKPRSKCIGAKKSFKKKDKVKQSPDFEDSCDKKCDLPQKNSVFQSQTSEAGVHSQMHSTVELPKKLQKKTSVKSSKAKRQANFLPKTVDSQNISQKKLEHAGAVKDKNKKTRKQSQAKSGTPTRKKAAIADTHSEQELPCETIESTDLQVMTHKDTNHQALSSPDEHKAEHISTGVKRHGKEGRGPKRKGNAKTKRNVTVEEKGKDGMTEREKKDRLSIKEHTAQSLTIAQPTLREKKAKKRKASGCGENGLNLNSCGVEKIPNSSGFALHEINHSISQHQSAKLGSKVEPTPKMLRRRKKACKKGTHSAKARGPSQPVLTEDLVLKTDSVNHTTSVPRSTGTKQSKQQTEKLCDFKEENKFSEFRNNTGFQDRCVMSPQKTQPILKGSCSKKLRLSRAQSAPQDIALTVVTAEAAPKATDVTVPKEENVQFSIANTSFDFAEEEFHVPVIKVTPRNDFSFEIQPEQSAGKKHKTNGGLVSNSAEIKSQISQERSSNTLSTLPEIKPQPLSIPLTAAKPVKKISSKRRKQKYSLKESAVGHSEVEKLRESSSDQVDEQQHQCTEIKPEQAENALSAGDMECPAGVQQSSSIQVSPLSMLKRKAGRPFKKKTLLRMAKILKIVQEGESCSTKKCDSTDYLHGTLQEKQLLQPPRVKKEKGAVPLVTPTRRSLRTGRTEVDHLSLSTISIDTDHEGHADTSCSSPLNGQSLFVEGFGNTVAQDSEKITVDDTDEQDPQKLIQVETTTVRPLKKKKKMKAKRKKGTQKGNQQLARASSIQKDDLLSNYKSGDGKTTEIKLEEAEFALSAVDMGHLAGLQQSSLKQTSPSATLKQKPGRPFTKKTMLRRGKLSKGVQEGKSSPIENCDFTDCVEGLNQEKPQHRPPRVKKEKESKPILTPTRRSLRALGSGRAQTDHPSLSATSRDSDHEGDTDTSLCEKSSASELSPDCKKTALNETDKQDPEKVTQSEMTTVRALKRKGKRKTLKPKKRKKGWRKLYQQLASVTSTQEDGLSPSNEDDANVNGEDGKSTEIKPEQAEFALTAVDIGHSAGLQQSSANQSPSAMLKRKVGRPFKKKTLLRMAKILKIVQEEKSSATGNMTIADNFERVLQVKQQQHQPPRIKKEKMITPAISPKRRSLRTIESGTTESSDSFLSTTIAVDTDHEENADTCSSASNSQPLSKEVFENTLAQDSEKTTVGETDQQDHQVTKAETTVVRTLKKRRKRKALNSKKSKVGWRKHCQQLARVTSTQEKVLSLSNDDGASIPTNDADVSKKVSSPPVSSKEEEQDYTILHSPQAASGPLEASTTTLNQENDDAECHKALSSNKIKPKSGCTPKEKASIKTRKSVAVTQTASELSESQLQADRLKCSKDVTTLKAEELSQPVSVAQATKLRRSSRGLNSTASSTVDQEQSQTTHNSSETTLSTLTEAKTEKLIHALLNDENDRKVITKDDDPSFEKQSSTNDQEVVSVPGQSKQKKKRGQKRKCSPKASQTVESAGVADPTNNLGASLPVAFTGSNSQSAANEQESTLKKSKRITEMPVNRGTKAQKKTLLKLSEDQSSDACSEKMDASIKANDTITPDFKIHTPLKSRTIVPSYETLRRSSRTSKTASIFYRSEEHTPPFGERSSSPTECSQDDMQSPDKTLHPSTTTSDDPTEGHVVSAVSSDTVEISTSCSVTDKGNQPHLETSAPVDSEITPRAQDLSPLGVKTAEAPHLTVEKKRRRRKIMGWDTRKKSKRGTYNDDQVIKKPDAQNVELAVTEENNDSFANSSEPDGDVLFVSKPLDEDPEEDSHPADGEMFENVSGHSDCQTLSSLNAPSPFQLEDKEVEGRTYCKEEVKKQGIMAALSEGQNGTPQFAKKARTSIICRFCKRSFRHISAYTVHQRLHTGERPYQCQQCGKRFSELSKLKSHRNEHKSQGLIQCPCCSQRFSKKEQLITHFKVHLPNAENITSDEKRSQASPSKSSTHLKKSTGNSFSCSVCSETFPSKQKLQIHTHIHEDKQFSCKDCGKTFSTQSSCSAHERVHWPLKPYACSVCGKGFRKLQALKAHSLDHTGETPFFCSHCGYACSDLQTLRAHQASRICSTKKQDDIEGFLIQMGVDGQVNTPNLFKCHLCKKLLNYWCQYTLHLQTHTKAHPYLCDTCGQSYDRDSDLRVHCRDCCKSSGEERACCGPLSDIWNSRETEEVPQTSHEPQSPEHMDEVCLILNDQSSVISQSNSPTNASMHGEDLPQSDDNPEPVLSSPSSPARSDGSILSSHPSLDCYIVSTYCSRTRTSHKRFECQHCGQRFRLSSILHAHLQTHLSGNKYTCGLCGRVFQRWHKLWLHQRLHQQKGRSFSCSDCNVQFRFLALYRQHLQEHAEQRPYACPLCPETFLSEANLNTHQSENHRLRRTLKCDVCGKGFSSLRNWVKHSLLHNGRSSHSCLLCDQSFTNNRALQEHLKMHNNDLRFPTSEIPSEPLLFPHQCWRCNASFSTGELLYAHQICHAVGGKPPPRPRGPLAAHGNPNAVTSTAPPPTVPEPSSVPEQPEPQQTTIPEINDESLFVYAHPDSLYVVPDPTPPPPRPTHSFSQSSGMSTSQASNHISSQQTIVLDEEDSLRDTTDTSLNAPGTSQTIPDTSSNQDGNLPQTSSQQSITELVSNMPQVQHTLSPKHKSNDRVKSFSVTIKLHDSRGFECADCSKVLSSAKLLHKHYLKHAKGVLAKIHI
ncbi:hypothetical protein ACEWY4_023753 [Coilia grayii]|uniref:C2H2-type domain-containing protein n=1 Tax=Coilia grayii TaxID=363190 RepID=A0ABD1J0B9_9TELE